MYLALALSGASALAAQVIWTRQLALLLGATVYTFSLVLAVFLVGLGVGSSIGSLLARTIEKPRVAFGWCQVLTVLAMAWSAYMLNASLPFWPVNVELSTDIWRTFHIDLARTFWAVLPAPILWGASFPLAHGCRGSARPGFGSCGGRALCGKHARRHCRFARRQPHHRGMGRHGPRATGPDDPGGNFRASSSSHRRSCRGRPNVPDWSG